ncbi:MAG: DUF3971 domain-containing protein, partial [Sedimentisphaerales bacterium]
FNAVYDSDTGWSNLSDLAIKPPKGSFRKIPNINLVSGTLQYVKILNGNKQVAISLPVDAEFKSDEQTERKYDFSITTATMRSGYGQSHLRGSWKPGDVTITGGIASLSVPKFEMAWMIDVLAAELKYDKNKNYSLALSAQNLQSLHSSENGLALEIPSFLRKYGCFSAMQEFLDTYEPKGLADVRLKVSGNFGSISGSKIDGYVDCKDVAFNYSRFKYPVDHVTGKIDFTQDGLSFSNVTGRHGDTEISFDGWYRNFGPAHEYKIDIASDKVPLEDELYQALSDKEKKFWSSFSPTGNINVDLQFEKHPETGRNMNLKLGLLDVSALYRDFPYPLKNLNGRLTFSRDKIMVQDVVSRNGDTEVALNGEILNRGRDDLSYNIAIEVADVPMDTTLEAALREDSRKVYRMLKPSGLANGVIQVSKPASGQMDFVADLGFRETTIQPDSLLDPVSDISAHAIFTPDLIVIKDFSGRYGDIFVSLEGQVTPDNEQKLGYDVSLDLENVQLNNKELERVLPESMKKIISRFDPNGGVNLIAHLKKDDPAIPIDYSVTINCPGNRMNLADFPYTLTDVTGTIQIDTDNIELQNISAKLDDSTQDRAEKATLLLDGDIQLNEGAFTKAQLKVSAQNILLDDRFEKILPQHCQGIYTALSPSGCMDVDFDNFLLLNGDDNSKNVEFSGVAKLSSCDFKMSKQPAKLDTVIEVHGGYVSGSGFNNCRLVVDNGTLNVLGKTLTALKAEIHYDPNQQTWSSRDLVANLYGGKTTGKFEFMQKDGSPMQYVLQTAFDNVDLKQFMSDTKVSREQTNSYTTGKMSGSLNLSSSVAEKNSRVGTCRLTIKNMQVGKMSPLANILQVLNLTEPSDYAFDSMFVDSYIRRNGLVVEKLDMSGKSVAFYGSGSIDLASGGVDLSLIARGHRLATDDPSILQSLTEGLGQAVVRMDVTGDYRNVKVATKALPVLQGTLQILGGKPVSTN